MARGIHITFHLLVACSFGAIRTCECSQHCALHALLSRLALLRSPACSSLLRNRHVVTADRWHIELLLNSVCHSWLSLCSMFCVLVFSVFCLLCSVYGSVLMCIALHTSATRLAVGGGKGSSAAQIKCTHGCLSFSV